MRISGLAKINTVDDDDDEQEREQKKIIIQA